MDKVKLKNQKNWKNWKNQVKWEPPKLVLYSSLQTLVKIKTIQIPI